MLWTWEQVSLRCFQDLEHLPIDISNRRVMKEFKDMDGQSIQIVPIFSGRHLPCHCRPASWSPLWLGKYYYSGHHTRTRRTKESHQRLFLKANGIHITFLKETARRSKQQNRFRTEEMATVSGQIDVLGFNESIDNVSLHLFILIEVFLISSIDSIGKTKQSMEVCCLDKSHNTTTITTICRYTTTITTIYVATPQPSPPSVATPQPSPPSVNTPQPSVT